MNTNKETDRYKRLIQALTMYLENIASPDEELSSRVYDHYLKTLNEETKPHELFEDKTKLRIFTVERHSELAKARYELVGLIEKAYELAPSLNSVPKLKAIIEFLQNTHSLMFRMES